MKSWTWKEDKHQSQKYVQLDSFWSVVFEWLSALKISTSLCLPVCLHILSWIWDERFLGNSVVIVRCLVLNSFSYIFQEMWFFIKSLMPLHLVSYLEALFVMDVLAQATWGNAQAAALHGTVEMFARYWWICRNFLFYKLALCYWFLAHIFFFFIFLSNKVECCNYH